MADLWTILELVDVVGGTVEPCLTASNGAGVPGVGSVSIDSRTLEPGALYVAIQGVAQDGHKFVGAAFQAGANAALVRSDYEPGSLDEGVLVRVPDPLAALEALGRAARARTGAKVIAVTGSAGKTGTKEALKDMLSTGGVCHASVKSFNNHWGVPLSLARMPAEARYAVFEVGMNHAGEILPLSVMIKPDVALITTVAPVHIGHFANEEEIADAKAEIFAGLKESGTAVLPIDNPHYERLKSRAREAGVAAIIGFGGNVAADARLLSGEFGRSESVVTADIMGEVHSFKIAIAGAHIALNLIGALAAVKLVGGDLNAAIGALSLIRAPEGRGVQYDLCLEPGEGDCVDRARCLLIDESYNANPASMEIALKNLSLFKSDAHSRRIAVIGDMLELGQGAKAYHRQLAPLVERLDVDLVFAAGEMMAHMFEDLPSAKQGAYAPTSLGLVDVVEKNIQQGDVVMVKGSLGSDMGRIVKRLRAKFSDGK